MPTYRPSDRPYNTRTSAITDNIIQYGFIRISGGLGHFPRPVRRAVHVAVPRYLFAGRRRGHTILSDAAVAQAGQHQGAENRRLHHRPPPRASDLVPGSVFIYFP